MKVTKPYTKYLFRWFYPQYNDPESLEQPRGFMVGVASTDKYAQYPLQFVNLSYNTVSMSFWPTEVKIGEYGDLMETEYEPTQKEVNMALDFLKVDDMTELKKKRIYKIFKSKDPTNPFLWF